MSPNYEEAATWLWNRGESSVELSSQSSFSSHYEATDEDGDKSSSPFMLENDPFVVSINGIVSPLLVLFIIVTNSFICIVLLKPHMRTPTNTLLLAIAVTDMLTGIWPMPGYIFFYTFKNCLDWVPFDWCSIYMSLAEYLPTISHTSSIWLTVILAFQRYICICHFQTGRRWFSKVGVLKAIICVYVAAILTHINRFFERIFTPVGVTSNLNPNVTMTSCLMTLKPFVMKHADVYFNIYYWFRVVFIHLLPCASLLILNALLIATLRSAQQRKVRLLGGRLPKSMGVETEQRTQRPSDSNSTTLMLVFVVGLFLLVEFPLAVLFIIYIIQNTFNVVIMNEKDISLATNIVNLVILFSYPINFFIYCAMSRAFRETFTKMIFDGRRSNEASSNTQYFSLATDFESRTAQPTKPDGTAQTEC